MSGHHSSHYCGETTNPCIIRLLEDLTTPSTYYSMFFFSETKAYQKFWAQCTWCWTNKKDTLFTATRGVDPLGITMTAPVGSRCYIQCRGSTRGTFKFSEKLERNLGKSNLKPHPKITKKCCMYVWEFYANNDTEGILNMGPMTNWVTVSWDVVCLDKMCYW